MRLPWVDKSPARVASINSVEWRAWRHARRPLYPPTGLRTAPMPYLILTDASLAFGHVPLLDHAEFQLDLVATVSFKLLIVTPAPRTSVPGLKLHPLSPCVLCSVVLSAILFTWPALAPRRWYGLCGSRDCASLCAAGIRLPYRPCPNRPFSAAVVASHGRLVLRAVPSSCRLVYLRLSATPRYSAPCPLRRANSRFASCLFSRRIVLALSHSVFALRTAPVSFARQ